MSVKEDLISDGEKIGCQHEVKNLVYLTTSTTPHVYEPDTLMIMQHQFICRNCSEVVLKNSVVSRGFLGDGTIHPAMQDELTKLQNKRSVAEQVEKAIKEGNTDGNPTQ